MCKKRIMLWILVSLLLWNIVSTCQAEIIPPEGEGQIGYLAVVLCESLTVRRDRSSASDAVKTLRYGDIISVQNNLDGWADCFLSDDCDAGQAGWVNADYILVNPAWYRTDGATPVYAWNDTGASKVALLSKGTMLPILKDERDWLLVSLRAATGWIRKNATDYLPAEVEEMIGILSDLKRAELVTPKKTYTLTDPSGLNWIKRNFSVVQPSDFDEYPFDAALKLFSADGRQITLRIAADYSNIFRTESGSCFTYGNEGEAFRQNGNALTITEKFWQLFGIADPYEDIY